MNSSTDYYRVLGVPSTADFSRLKRAYFRRAMECHPDRFSGDRSKEGEFRLVAEAFQVLSDPVQRRDYDRLREPGSDDAWTGAMDHPVWFGEEDEGAILGTFADDILEELIVGNTYPVDTCLATLMLDLERTERFCMLREAKNFLYAREIGRAAHIFQHYLQVTPHNVLARYYLGRCFLLGGRQKDADREWAMALNYATLRVPPLRCTRIRRELDRLRRRRKGLWSTLRSALVPPPPPEDVPPDVAMRRAVSRAIRRQLAAEARRSRELAP